MTKMLLKKSILVILASDYWINVLSSPKVDANYKKNCITNNITFTNTTDKKEQIQRTFPFDSKLFLFDL